MNKNLKIKIKPIVLIRVWKKIKSNPDRIWLMVDFNNLGASQLHMHTLIKMGLVEEVPAIYKLGKKYRSCLNTKGYKLINYNPEGISGEGSRLKFQKEVGLHREVG